MMEEVTRTVNTYKCYKCEHWFPEGEVSRLARTMGDGTGAVATLFVCELCLKADFNASMEKIKPSLDAFIEKEGAKTAKALAGQPAVLPQTWVVDGGKDRSKIWDDCAQCAFKHLTAAYACASAAMPPSLGGLWAGADQVMEARALIALREAETGYPGNRALAAGCLAMAELFSEHPDDVSRLREARLRLQDGKPGAADTLSSAVPFEAWAGAHFTEALRELPALASRIKADEFVSWKGVHAERADRFLTVLRDNIAWLSYTFEIGRGGAE